MGFITPRSEVQVLRGTNKLHLYAGLGKRSVKQFAR